MCSIRYVCTCWLILCSEQLTATFGLINGLLIPGGAEDIADPTNPFLVAATTLYNLAVQSNNNGDFFPIWVR
jgi:hypothetical protein